MLQPDAVHLLVFQSMFLLALMVYQTWYAFAFELTGYNNSYQCQSFKGSVDTNIGNYQK